MKTGKTLATAAFVLAVSMAATLFPISVTYVQAQNLAYMSCNQLWYARNAIYAEKGYCFKTARARATFGPRCYPPYGKLSRSEQNTVAAIKRWERQKGC